MGSKVNTPVGRIVWGHPLKSKVKKELQTKQPILNADGSQKIEWAFGLAIPKAEFEQTVWPVMSHEAALLYPTGNIPQKFSWKFTDATVAIDDKGQPYANREGHAGCVILAITTTLKAPDCFRLVNGTYVQMTENEIKCGDYVSVALNLVGNLPAVATHTPSLYVNPEAIEFIGYGDAIDTSPDPNELFGGLQHQLPPGASATPVASSNIGMPGTAPPAQPMQAAPPAQPMQAAPPAQPMQAAPPAQPMQAAPPAQPMQAAPPAQPMQAAPPAQPMQAAPPAQPMQAAPPAQPMQAAPPAQPMQAAPPAQPMQAAPPAHDFVQNAGNPQPGMIPNQ